MSTATVDGIIEIMGGADAVARRLGVGTEAVRKWRQSHSIPARHWPTIIAATGLALADMPGASVSPDAEPDGVPAAVSAATGDGVPEGATAALALADGSI